MEGVCQEYYVSLRDDTGIHTWQKNHYTSISQHWQLEGVWTSILELDTLGLKYPLWMGSVVSEQSQVSWSCHSHHTWRTPSWRTIFLTQSQVSYQWDRKCGPASAGTWDEVQPLTEAKKAEVEMGLGKAGEDKVKRRQGHRFPTSESLLGQEMVQMCSLLG